MNGHLAPPLFSPLFSSIHVLITRLLFHAQPIACTQALFDTVTSCCPRLPSVAALMSFILSGDPIESALWRHVRRPAPGYRSILPALHFQGAPMTSANESSTSNADILASLTARLNAIEQQIKAPVLPTQGATLPALPQG